jgi:hypothetical protein
MKVTRDDSAITLNVDVKTAKKLADEFKEHTGALEATNGMRALASVLQQAVYEAKDHFRQPPHAFDDKAPRQPSIED